MNAFSRIFCAATAVILLTAYFFSDVVLVENLQMMSWEEFSSNPRAVAKFKERDDAMPSGPNANEAETRRAYERYAGTANQAAAQSAGIGSGGGEFIAAFKTNWRRAYRFWGSGAKRRTQSSRTRSALSSPVARERVGMIATLVVLGGVVMTLSFADRVIKEKARL